VLVTAGATLKAPEGASVPDHAPDAVHDAALVADHVKVLLAPASIERGLADRVTVGFGGCTVTVIDKAGEVPLAFVQASVYVAVAAGVTTSVPEVACSPDQAPEAVHDVALVEDHLRVLVAPTTSVAGAAESFTFGTVFTGGVTATVTAAAGETPLALEQVKT